MKIKIPLTSYRHHMEENVYEIHKYCAIIPEIDKVHLDELAENIRQHGLNDPIVLHDGKILDGRSRFAACQKIGITPHFVDFAAICPAIDKDDTPQEEKDKVAFDWVISHNVHRRHLNPSQRAMLVANIANLRAGNPTWGKTQSDQPVMLQTDVAAKAGVSPALVSHAQKVMREAPEKVAEIQLGKTTVNSVVKEIEAKKAAQKENDAKESKTAFAKAVIDGTHTGKAFRKKAGELTKLIEQCVLATPVVEYLGVCTTLDSLTNIVAAVKKLPNFVQMKELEKRIDSLKKEKQELYDEIADIIIFCHKTYGEWKAALEQMAATDEENALLSAADVMFKEHVDQIKSDMKMTSSVTCIIADMTTKSVSGEDYVIVFKASNIMAARDSK